MEPIKLGDQKFIKVGDTWVDQNKKPAPKGLVELLDRVSKENIVAPSQEQFESKTQFADQLNKRPPLPRASAESTAIKSTLDKLEKSIAKLVTVLEKLTKIIDKSVAKPSAPATRLYEQDRVQSLGSTIMSNVGEVFTGAKDKYGRVERPGVTRGVTEALLGIPAKAVFAAKDRRRATIANELHQYEESLKHENPTMSLKQINDKVREKKLELENPKKAFKSSEASRPKAEEAPMERTKSSRWVDKNTRSFAKESDASQDVSSDKPKFKSIQEAIAPNVSKFGTQDINTKMESVKVADIEEAAIKKLRTIFANKGNGRNKEDGNLPGGGMALGGGLVLALGALAAKFKPVIEGLTKLGQFIWNILSKFGVFAIAAVKKGADVVKGAAAKGGELIEKGVGAAKGAAAKLVEKGAASTAIKAGGQSLLKKIPGVGLVAAGALATGRVLKKDWVGAGLEIASGAASTVPGAGTAASLGIDAALVARDLNQDARPAVMAKPKGLTPQTHALSVTTRKVEAAKAKPILPPVIVNNNTSSPTNITNSQSIIGGPTVADRGSLDRVSY